MRLAHFGTFDVENYGDLLFPLVAQRRLEPLGAELVSVSPVGGPPVWGDCVATVTADTLEDSQVDGVLLGGGNIVHGGPAGIDDYRQDGLTWLLAYARLWTQSAELAAARGLPLCWNAPGVPQRFPPRVAAIVRTAADAAAYVAVRDHHSLGNLRDAGVDRRVEVVPDTAFDVSQLFPAEALDEAYERIFADRGHEKPERTLAVHLNRRYLDGDAEVTARYLDGLAAATDSFLLLLALGPCHGDDETARSVAAHLSSAHTVVDRPASLRELVAAISRAGAFAGSSLHGMITALAFRRPALVVAKEAATGSGKFSGLLRQLRLNDRLVSSWKDAERHSDALNHASDVQRAFHAADGRLDVHWQHVREALTADPAGLAPTLKLPTDVLLEEGVRAANIAATRERARAQKDRRLVEGLERQLSAAREATDLERHTAEAALTRADEVAAELERRKAEATASARERDDFAQRTHELQSEVDAQRQELGALRREKTRADELERQLGLLSSEHERAGREFQGLQRTIDELRRHERNHQRELTDSQKRLGEAHEQMAAAREGLAAERAQAQCVEQELAVQRREVQDGAAKLERLAGELREVKSHSSAHARLSAERKVKVQRLEEQLRTAQADLDDRVLRIERAKGELVGFEESVARLAESNAWRTGHRLMRLARLLTFRRAKGKGAMPRLVGQAERAQAALELPLAQSRPVSSADRAATTNGPASGNGGATLPNAVQTRALPAQAERSATLVGLRADEAKIGAPQPPRDARGILRNVGSREAESVDVVVCIHDALPDLHRCLSSVLERSDVPLRLILVDDGSGDETALYLARFAELNPAVDLRRNADPPHGYTIAANIGLRASTADYVVLLNSDTVVTRGWLTHLLAAGRANERVGIIGPLSNAASHQSVPRSRDRDDWAVNELPDWLTEDGVALVVRSLPGEDALPVPFLNGFCYCIRRRTIDAIGTFDEDHFAAGFSEENDYSRRAAEAGLELVVAARAYVLHAKSRSYGHAGRRDLAKRHYRVFLKRHGEEHVRQLVDELQNDPSLAALRSRIGAALERPERTVDLLPRLRVTFVLPGMSKGGSGGSHSVYQEVAAMRSVGLKARIALAASALPTARETYPDGAEFFMPYANDDELLALAEDDDVLVATHFRSVPSVSRVVAERPACLAAYYVQDYEPLFAAAGSESALAAERSYSEIPGCLLFAKTEWLQQTLSERSGLPVSKVEPSIDNNLFHARGRREKDGRVHVVAMVRPRTPRRAPAETLALLHRLTQVYGSQVQVTTFGCDKADLARFDHVGGDREHRGILSRSHVADLLRTADVFVDCSWYQAFGRTGLEAMACGATAVLPQLGGATEFARDGENCLLTDTWELDAVFASAARLIDDPFLLAKLKASAVTTANRYSALRAALSEYSLFCHEYKRRTALATIPSPR